MKSGHAPEGDAKRGPRHQLVLDDRAKQLTGDTQLLLGVLVEEAVLVKQVVDHAGEDLALVRVGRVLEAAQHFNDLHKNGA